jgi:hypothetical protein
VSNETDTVHALHSPIEDFRFVAQLGAAVRLTTAQAEALDTELERLAERLSSVLKLGVPKSHTYTRQVIGEVIRDLRGTG